MFSFNTFFGLLIIVAFARDAHAYSESIKFRGGYFGYSYKNGIHRVHVLNVYTKSTCDKAVAEFHTIDGIDGLYCEIDYQAQASRKDKADYPYYITGNPLAASSASTVLKKFPGMETIYSVEGEKCENIHLAYKFPSCTLVMDPHFDSHCGVGTAMTQMFWDLVACNPVGEYQTDGTCKCTDPATTGPACEYSDATTCSNAGIAQPDGTCVCNDPSIGAGPCDCSGGVECPYTNAKTCSDAGVVDATGKCTCDGPETGVGPTCSEYTNAKTCNGAGVVDATGKCTCDGPETGLGPTCSEYTNAKTCNGAGIVSASNVLTVSGPPKWLGTRYADTEPLMATFLSEGTTAGGNEYFMSLDGGMFVYFARYTCGRSFWTFDSSRPNTTLNFIDGDLGHIFKTDDSLGSLVAASNDVRGFLRELGFDSWSAAARRLSTDLTLTIEMVPKCACSDPAIGNGPTCSEYTNAKNCSDAGVVDATGKCTCDGPETGVGRTCSEYTNAKTCNGAGIVSAPNSSVNVVTVSGACSMQSHLNTMFISEGTTADGKEFFVSQNGETFLYFDSDCDNEGTEGPGWIFGKYKPNTIALSGLQRDRLCWFDARINVGEVTWHGDVLQHLSGPSGLPLTSMEQHHGLPKWKMNCGKGNRYFALTLALTPLPNETCACSDPAIGTGPTCSEYTNALTCSNAGIAQPDGSCVCNDPAVGTGPTCSEYTNNKTCSNAGIAQHNGTCVCNDPDFGGEFGNCSATECGPDCPHAWVGDGFCDSACRVTTCGSDKGDCSVANDEFSWDTYCDCLHVYIKNGENYVNKYFRPYDVKDHTPPPFAAHNFFKSSNVASLKPGLSLCLAKAGHQNLPPPPKRFWRI